jgi:hypothetical protein
MRRLIQDYYIKPRNKQNQKQYKRKNNITNKRINIKKKSTSMLAIMSGLLLKTREQTGLARNYPVR